jgi:hypothetical protein
MTARTATWGVRFHRSLARGHGIGGGFEQDSRSGRSAPWRSLVESGS